MKTVPTVRLADPSDTAAVPELSEEVRLALADIAGAAREGLLAMSDHLPDKEKAWVDAKLVKAFGHPDPDQGLRGAKHLAGLLDKTYPGAAASLRDDMPEMFTLARFGIDGRLAKTLTTSNPIESMISIARTTNRNVTRWRDGHMVLRWTAAGMLNAERSFRRIKGPQADAAAGRRASPTRPPRDHYREHRNYRHRRLSSPWIVTQVPRDSGHARQWRQLP